MLHPVLRGISVAGGLFLLVAAVFTLYSYFLVDYSLEDLEVTLSMGRPAKENFETPIFETRLYLKQNLFQDMAIDEMSNETPNLNTLSFLDLASRSIRAGFEPANYGRALLYLSQVKKDKAAERRRVLLFADTLHRFWNRGLGFISSILDYLRKRFFPYQEKPIDVSSLLILAQAEEKMKGWHLEEAADLYSRYLKLYPHRPDRAFVTLSLADIFIKLSRFSEAQRMLQDIQIVFIGSEEGVIAAQFLKKIDSIRGRQAKIGEFLDLISQEQDPVLRGRIELHLAKEYLFSYQIPLAEEILGRLVKARDDQVRQKAMFYLAWIYKMQVLYDQSEHLFLDLSREEILDRDLELGFEAQLADIYYRKKDIRKAVIRYEILSEKAKRQILDGHAIQEAWVALAELEQAGIYYTNLRQPETARRHLDAVGANFSGNPFFADFGQILDAPPPREEDVRDLAFRALRQGQVHMAKDLFEKYLKFYPQDAWSHSGLATVFFLLAKVRDAVAYADKGYRFKADEYTASVQGWILQLLNQHDKAIPFYIEAIGKKEDYLAANYNLAISYMKKRNYQGSFEILEQTSRVYVQVGNVMRSKILNNLGVSFWGLGQHAEALKLFYKSVEFTPEFSEGERNLSQTARLMPQETVNSTT